MTYVFIGIAVAVVVGIIIFTVMSNNAINKNGIETDAVVSRIDEDTSRDDNGDINTTYTYYVSYQTEDGTVVEAKLGKAPHNIRQGMQLRIKYLPEKPKYVIAVK